MTGLFWGYLAVILTFVSYVPYFRGLYLGRTRPHIFTWIIWGMLTGIAFFAQTVAGAGAGAWVTGVSAVFCFIVVVCAVRSGSRDITRSDRFSFAAALSALPLWYITADPFYAVLWVTVIDMLGYYPTVRKSWRRPDEEPVMTYLIAAVKFLCGVFALETVTFTTALYPASLVVMNAAFVVMVLWRRRAINLAVQPSSS